MNTKHAELLNLQQSVDENPNRENSSELIHREAVQGSPFYIIGNKEMGYFLTFGKYRLTEPQETIVKVREILYNDMWNIVTNLCLCIIGDVDFKKIRDLEPHKVKTVNESYSEKESREYDEAANKSLGQVVKEKMYKDGIEVNK